jgi:cyclic pyranopterin phosphate synthase
MVDITHKSSTFRSAKAEAIVKLSRKETMEAIHNRAVPKGDIFEMAKAAAFFGIKRTSDMIPDCHPIPVEHASVSYEINELSIKIKVEVSTVYKTGVEVEAMHGASIAALTIYDMLKPLDKEIEISSIKLVEKKGGKSDYIDSFKKDIKAAVIVCSDSISSGKGTDKAGKAIIEKLAKYQVLNPEYIIIPDEESTLRSKVEEFCKNSMDMVLITGGTGLSKRDITPEVIKPLLDREIPGVMEAARSYGQDRTPYAMFSRGLAGVKGDTLILALPGSTRGASETMDALFPAILHIYRILAGNRHS